MCTRIQASDEHTTQRALCAFEAEGVVVLERAVDPRVLERIRERMLPETERLLRARVWGGAGRQLGHLQQTPPRGAPYVCPEIVANRKVLELVRRILGDGFFLSLYSANVNTPGSATQQVHADAGHLWFNSGTRTGKWQMFHPTTTLVVNIPLTRTDEHNGSTEVYLGSHKDIDFEQWIPQQQLARYPVARANCEQGDVVIRDIRTWHRGMTNHAETPRHMLAMILNVWWLHRGRRNRFHSSARPAFQLPYFDANAIFSDRDTDSISDKAALFQVPYLFEGTPAHRAVNQRAARPRAALT